MITPGRGCGDSPGGWASARAGRYDGENYNLGFVNQVDLPYPEMVSFARETHRRMVPVHAGSTAPADRMAKVR